MSRKLLAFLSSELAVIRILCRHNGCKGIIETEIGKIEKNKFKKMTCPVCGHSFIPENMDVDPFHHLQKFLEAATMFPWLEFEFILPDNGKADSKTP